MAAGHPTTKDVVHQSVRVTPKEGFWPHPTEEVFYVSTGRKNNELLFLRETVPSIEEEDKPPQTQGDFLFNYPPVYSNYFNYCDINFDVNKPDYFLNSVNYEIIDANKN